MKEAEGTPSSIEDLFRCFAPVIVVIVMISLAVAWVVWYYTDSILKAVIVVVAVYVVTIFIVMIRSKLLL